MKLLFLFFGLISAICDYDFGSGVKLSWNNLDGETLINLTVKQSVLSQFGWVGLGIKHYVDGYDMSHGDFYTIIFDGTVLEDKFAEHNGAPKPDEEAGGETNIFLDGQVTNDDGSVTYSLRRWQDTQDKYDTFIGIKSIYYWQWAYGQVVSGALKKHENKGFVPFRMEECPIN